MMASDARLRVSSVSSGYGPIEALHGIDLHVMPGEIVAVLGANGAGKTTLVNTISGIVRARNGEIYWDGDPISRMPTHKIVRHGIVQVPEGRRIFAELSVDENLTVGGYVSKDKIALASTREMIFTLFPILADRRSQSAGTLSGGEQQMLAIGRALCGNPQLLMLDEPSMGLAPLVVASIYSSFATIVEAGTTILLIEQNAGMALKASSRAYVLDQGRVVMTDDSSELSRSSDLQQLYLGGHTAKIEEK